MPLNSKAAQRRWGASVIVVATWAAMALLCIGLAGCKAIVQSSGAGQQDAERKAGMQGGNEIESLERTVLRVGNGEIAVTREDAKAMQSALLAYLKTSNYADRDELIQWTQGASSPWIDSHGAVRIGPWLLGAEDEKIFLRYREPPGKLAAKAHKAYLANVNGAWKVTDLRSERIAVRR